jgi:hypothetical protein
MRIGPGNAKTNKSNPIGNTTYETTAGKTAVLAILDIFPRLITIEPYFASITWIGVSIVRLRRNGIGVFDQEEIGRFHQTENAWGKVPKSIENKLLFAFRIIPFDVPKQCLYLVQRDPPKERNLNVKERGTRARKNTAPHSSFVIPELSGLP